MKKLFTFLTILTVSYSVSAQKQAVAEDKTTNQVQVEATDAHAGHDHGTTATTTTTPTPVAETISFDQTEFDFGKIPQGKPVTHVFLFSNTGKTGLKLDNVQASCGCTTPEWSRDEVAPANQAKITVGYNAAAEGPFTKTITVTYNGGATKVLTIRGEVWKTPATSAPENGTLNNIKN